MGPKVDLDTLRIAKLRPARWEDMPGDARVRHCALCKKNVHNLSAWMRAEAGARISESEGTPCVRLYQRAGGTILTADCPVGVKAWRRSVAGVIVAATWIAAIAAAGTPRPGPSEACDGEGRFTEALDSAKAFLVEQLPDWVISVAWRPKLEPTMVYLGSPGISPPVTSRPKVAVTR